MLRFPKNPNHIANRIDIADVADRVRANGSRLRVLDARLTAKRTFASNPKAKALYFVCNEPDDTVSLRRFGPRGGSQRVWNFGSI